MADKKNLNELLKWSIENTPTNSSDDPQQQEGAPKTNLNPEALAALFGGPSDAELMQASVAHITSTDPEVTHESRLTAFDNLEQLIESLDNANLLSKLGLWTPLLELLGHAHPDIRRMAAWCVGTAVQNNEPCQERLVALGGVERLVRLALGHPPAMERRAGDTQEETAPPAEKESSDVRRKAVYALSSAVRNYQPALDVATSELAKLGEGPKDNKVDATDMDAVDVVINDLKEKAVKA